MASETYKTEEIEAIQHNTKTQIQCAMRVIREELGSETPSEGSRLMDRVNRPNHVVTVQQLFTRNFMDWKQGTTLDKRVTSCLYLSESVISGRHPDDFAGFMLGICLGLSTSSDTTDQNSLVIVKVPSFGKNGNLGDLTDNVVSTTWYLVNRTQLINFVEQTIRLVQRKDEYKQYRPLVDAILEGDYSFNDNMLRTIHEKHKAIVSPELADAPTFAEVKKSIS